MKIACLSDLHWNLPKLPPVDLVLIAGDLSHAGYKQYFLEQQWLLTNFRQWLELYSLPTIIVGGNHDFYIQKNINELRNILPCQILENSAIEFNGVKIFGTPYSREYCEWAYQATEPQHSVQSPDLASLDKIFAMDDCVTADIVISHGPPLGIGDMCGDKSLGSHSLRKLIMDHSPPLVLCGHIHEGYGIYLAEDTVVINCAFVTPKRVARNEVIVVDFDEKCKKIKSVQRVAYQN